MSSYSQDFRDIVITKYKEGLTDKELSSFFNIDIRTTRSWINLYEATGDYKSKQGVGCGRIATFTDKEAIEMYLKEYPDAMALEIREALAPEIPRSTFYDCLNRLGFSFKKRRPNISKGKNEIDKTL